MLKSLLVVVISAWQHCYSCCCCCHCNWYTFAGSFDFDKVQEKAKIRTHTHTLTHTAFVRRQTFLRTFLPPLSMPLKLHLAATTSWDPVEVADFIVVVECVKRKRRHRIHKAKFVRFKCLQLSCLLFHFIASAASHCRFYASNQRNKTKKLEKGPGWSTKVGWFHYKYLFFVQNEIMDHRP